MTSNHPLALHPTYHDGQRLHPIGNGRQDGCSRTAVRLYHQSAYLVALLKSFAHLAYLELLQEQDRTSRNRYQQAYAEPSETRGTAECVELARQVVERGTQVVAGAGKLCWRGGQGDGQEKGAGQGSARGEIW